MSISIFERNATIAEMAVEMDRRGAAIERLEAQLAAAEAKAARLETALEPFARDVANFQRLASDDILLDGTPYEKKSRLTLGDLRRARAALEAKP